MTRRAWLLLACLAGQGSAASFDCARARSAAERAICADPALGAADERVAAAYRRALAVLSPAGKAMLRDEQRRRASWTAAECRPGGLAFLGTGDGKPQTFTHCLLLAFEQRARELDGAVTLAGGHRFLTLHPWRWKHAPPSDDGDLPPIVSEDVTLVQIDGPRSAGERGWNAAIRRLVADATSGPGGYTDGDGPGTMDVGVELASASPEVISATVGASTYSGGAHPNYASTTLAWSVPLGRALTAADVFTGPRSPTLRRLVSANYGDAYGKGHKGCDEPDLAKSKFVMDAAGIRFAFDPYELGAYTCGGESKLIWTALQPFLKRPLPFDPARLERPRAVDAAAPAR